MTVHRAELRARYPAILESASLSYGPGWAGLMEALCERLQFHTDNNTMPPVQITPTRSNHASKRKMGRAVRELRGRRCPRGRADRHGRGPIRPRLRGMRQPRHLAGRASLPHTLHSAHGPAHRLNVKLPPWPAGRTRLAGVHRRPHARASGSPASSWAW